MIKFSIGVIFASVAISGYIIFASPSTINKVRAVAVELKDKTSNIAFSKCKQAYLEDTACYQNKMFSSSECDIKISERCK